MSVRIPPRLLSLSTVPRLLPSASRGGGCLARRVRLGERRPDDGDRRFGGERSERVRVVGAFGQLGVVLEEPLEPGRRDHREQDGRLAADVLPCMRDTAGNEYE